MKFLGSDAVKLFFLEKIDKSTRFFSENHWCV